MIANTGVHQGKDGVYHYDVVVNKRRFCGSTGQTDKRLAITWTADFKALKRREAADEELGIKVGPTFTVKELWQDWLKHHGGAHAARVSRDWKHHILPKIEHVKVMKVTTQMAEFIRTAYLAAPCLTNLVGKIAEQMKAKGKKVVAKKRTNNGANCVMRNLSLVFAWAVKTERLPRKPFKNLSELTEQEPVKTFLRKEQVAPFLEKLDGYGNLHVRVAIRMMLYLGLRECEALHMKWSGFDQGYQVFTAVDTKTGKNIPLPVPEVVRPLLAELRTKVAVGCHWCLPSGYNDKKKAWVVHAPQYTCKPIRRVSKLFGITGLTPHRFRGSMATLMARSGSNAFVIQKAGRWTKMETALKYVKLVEEDIAAAQNLAFDF